jgi:hypothetical protein
MQHINHWHIVAVTFSFLWVSLPVSSLIAHHICGGWRTSFKSWVGMVLFTVVFMFGIYIGAGLNLGFLILLPIVGGGWLYSKVCSYLERYDVWTPEKTLDASTVKFIILKLALITAASAWLVNYLPASLLCVAVIVAMTCLIAAIMILIEYREIDGIVKLLGESRRLDALDGEWAGGDCAASVMPQTSCHAWKARVRSAR